MNRLMTEVIDYDESMGKGGGDQSIEDYGAKCAQPSASGGHDYRG